MSHIESSETDYWRNDGKTSFVKEWKSWCRLCAKADAQYINVLSRQYPEFLHESTNYNPFDMVSVIGDFFRVHIKEDEKLSPMVCTDCCHVIASFVKFSENVGKVQQLYDDLLHSDDKTKVDILAVYEKYGLTKELSAVQQATTPTVEEVFIADSPNTSNTHASKYKVKKEKASDELSTEVFIKEFEKKDELDPFGEDSAPTGLKDCPSTPDDESSSGSEDYNMPMDTSEDEEDSKNNAVNNEILQSDNPSEISKKRKYICKFCSQRFQRSGNYSVHMKKKHGIIVCPKCTNSFENELSLKRHMKDHQELFPCPHCDRKFQIKEYVAQHIKFVHQDERPFICETCGDGLRTKGQLKEHMLTHTDYSPFECKECGKCFKQKQRLKRYFQRHMQIHGDKHICTECGKQLSTRATLNSHLLVHSDKMPHKCDYCGRLFKRAKTLKNHLIAHTGLRPYSCDFCEKTFSTGPSCRFHKKTMHPVELAALEASGVKAYTRNIPNLDVLKAVSRTADNLTPLASKQNGYAVFDKKRDIPDQDLNSKPVEDANK
ncbi:PREDICTED: zinc finger protein weckle-like isoform X1 [Rhagoletis zephyria]|uniref:zinc finger protein weckle-like isoform X1 n=1 Tax=Rhagoletis zephyria TaxID=28612 RepID=UPI0008115DC0|nr:PREDICTED: zinc finger protein weckle-like isoform X1 [Rhagoletis zephyria]